MTNHQLFSHQQRAALAQLSTLGEFVKWTEQLFLEHQLFFGHVSLDAWDEAVWLIFHLLNLSLDADNSILSSPITEEQKAKCLPLIEKRITDKVPVPYLLKSAMFAGLEFYVDERVLIPRSPLAELIENQFEPWIAPEQVKSILEIGTGSGCIALACAVMFPDATVDAVDISDDALAVANINLEKHHLQSRVNFIKSDLYENLNNKRYDIIISNPPYLDEIDMTDLPAEYQHEPMNALAAGQDGLQFAIPIFAHALEHLNPGGIVIIEVGNSEHALYEKYPHIPFYQLEFERGENFGVVMLTYEQLLEHQSAFNKT